VFGKAKLYERLLAEKDERIRLLLLEREAWSSPAMSRIATVLPPPGEPAASEQGAAGWVSETEEAEAILAETGLSVVHLPEILDGLGYGSSDLS
jgi:hypothetical protein